MRGREVEDRPIIVVGAGVAGISAIDALRENGFEGRIVLLSKESTPPYDRPPLSKEVLSSDTLPSNVWLRNDAFYAANGVELRLGVSAVSIDPCSNTVTLSDGTQLAYDKLLLTTGSRARTMPLLPAEKPHVHYLRTLDDARRLRHDMATLAEGAKAAIVGAGIIGLEVAAAASALGLQVTVIEAGDRPLARSASPSLAAFLARAHAEHGVDIRCGVQITNIGERDSSYILSLSDGSEIAANLIVVGIGVLPNAEVAVSAGLDVAPEGVSVDAQGRTSVKNIYAAGEVAFHRNEHHGAQRRDETWQHAANHGAHVARCMLGLSDAYAEISAYWTDQYGYNIQVVGDPHDTHDVIRGNIASGSFLIFHLRDSLVVGISAINAARELRRSRHLVMASASVPEMVLSDITADLTKY